MTIADKISVAAILAVLVSLVVVRVVECWGLNGDTPPLDNHGIWYGTVGTELIINRKHGFEVEFYLAPGVDAPAVGDVAVVWWSADVTYSNKMRVIAVDGDKMLCSIITQM